jgi:hypothetical protein
VIEECIGLYFKGTQDEGLILNPTGRLDIDCYVNADFAGLWPHEDKNNPTCIKSRTGAICHLYLRLSCNLVKQKQTDIVTSSQNGS